ncbi:GTP cyclohydrolase I FolE, partial [Candidatus Peregrinibacteria bacterium]|nr:GTP cyclohydrolase I FolE [Candidatus Peregrinibacteria bacterium]
MENDKISRLIKELLAEVDPNPTREGLSETPARV